MMNYLNNFTLTPLGPWKRIVRKPDSTLTSLRIHTEIYIPIKCFTSTTHLKYRLSSPAVRTVCPCASRKSENSCICHAPNISIIWKKAASGAPSQLATQPLKWSQPLQASSWVCILSHHYLQENTWLENCKCDRFISHQQTIASQTEGILYINFLDLIGSCVQDSGSLTLLSDNRFTCFIQV